MSDGFTVSKPARVELLVTAVPLAYNDSYRVVMNEVFRVNPPEGVLANDRDAQGDRLEAVLVAGPTHGQLTLDANGKFVYTPDPGLVGTDKFTYRATDGQGLSPIATVTLTVSATNAAPLPGPDFYSMKEDEVLAVPAANGVLANDWDPDGDRIVDVRIVSGPSKGQVTLRADGSFEYRPNANANGKDTFTYQVSDGRVWSKAATVTLTITPVNDAPIAQEDAYQVAEDGMLVVQGKGVLANDTDMDGDKMTAQLIDGPDHGRLWLSTTGAFVYLPDWQFVGVDHFQYVASDGQSQSQVTQVTINVVDCDDDEEGGLIDWSGTWTAPKSWQELGAQNGKWLKRFLVELGMTEKEIDPNREIQILLPK